ncbi:MAG TPA: glycosyltransferase family 2 protein [Gemmatimonadaceae bacterium]
MDTPLVSVIIPTHNRAHLLPASIATVLAQTISDLEVIVVDDGSRDATPDVLAQIVAREPRVRVVRHEHALGAAAARNRGITEARGRFIAFNDDDCTWTEHKLEQQIAALETVGADVAYCVTEIRAFGGHVHRVGLPMSAADSFFGEVLRRNTIGTPMLVVRREALERSGLFDVTLPALEDWELLLRLARSGAPFVFVPDVVVRTAMLEGGLSTRSGVIATACDRIERSLRQSFSLDAGQWVDFHTTVGHLLMLVGCTNRARRHFARALRRSPLAFRPLLLGFASLLGGRMYRRLIAFRERHQGTVIDRIVDWFWS